MEYTKEFTRPDLIPKGSDKLGLGRFKTPPQVDCRVVANDLYLDMEKAFSSRKELLVALEECKKELERYTSPHRGENSYAYNLLEKAINNAKS